MLNIPEDKLPAEWKNEDRLNSLFSPFRSRTVNPKDWDTKVSTWKHIIWLYCVNNGVYSFTLAQLNKAFIRNGRPPSCLSVVVEELVKSGELQYVEDFLNTPSQTWSGWAADLLVKKPMVWSYNKIRRSLFSDNTNHDRTFVHTEVIREESQKLLSKVPPKLMNKVISFSVLLRLMGEDVSQTQDIKLLLHHLASERKVAVSNLKNGSNEYDSFLIKFNRDKVKPVSEVDVGVYVLEQNENVFTKHVEDLEDELVRCREEAKGHLLKGHRQLAKTCLKKKHEIEKRLERKINALHNVQVLLERIRDVHTDADVWQSYKHALAAFNTTFKETGLNEDAVEDTMLKLGDMLEVNDDIQTTISRPLSEGDEDFEAELAELIKEDKSDENVDKSTEALEEQLGKLSLNFPDVPSPNVSMSQASMG